MTPLTLPASYTSTEEYREENRFWWHERIAKELHRLRDECDTPTYNVKGLAGNIGIHVLDVDRYVRQMLLWGEVVSTEPLWDYAPESWVALAEIAAGPSLPQEYRRVS